MPGRLVDRGDSFMNAGNRRVDRFGCPIACESGSEAALSLSRLGEEKLVIHRVRSSAFQILSGNAGKLRVT